MRRDPVFEALKDVAHLRTLVWQLPLHKGSYSCPFDRCGELLRTDPLDTPPRNFRELAEGLIVSHFMGQCSWCRELSPAGTGSDASKVGRIEAVEPVSGATVPFFVFVQDKRWTISMQSPADPKGFLDAAMTLKQNPLFATGGTVLHNLGCSEVVLSCLHPCIKEAVEAKDSATRELLDCTHRLNSAATVLLHATHMRLPAAIGNVHTCTELAVSASEDAMQKWHAANAAVVQRLASHSLADLRVFSEFTQFMGGN